MAFRSALLACLTVTLLAGCGALARPGTPEVLRLSIEGNAAEIPQSEAVPHSILVSQPRALPGYTSPRFAYRERSHELHYYARHAWAAEPARMLQPAVVRALDESGRFSSVVSAPSPANADFRLELELVELLHDYTRPGEAEVTLRVRAQLMRVDPRGVIATRSFRVRELAGTGPLAGAGAADTALSRLLEELVEFCVEHIDG